MLTDRWPRFPLLIAGTTFLCFALTIGITQYSFGVFVTELEAEFGWTRTRISAALSFFALAGVAALLVGWALDRFGSRPVMVVSLSMLAVSYLLRPFMTELWQFYALNALQFAATPGAALIAGTRLIGLWFTRARGRAMGLTAMGANFGGIVFSTLTAVLIAGVGWRSTYALYGAMFCALLPLVILVVREPEGRAPAEGTRAGGDASLRQALRSRTFYLVVAALLLAQVTYQSVLPQLVPHLENVGITRERAALALSGFALFGMGGKVLFGWLCERYPVRYALMGGLACQVAGIGILLTAGSSPWVWSFVPIFGLGFGSLGAVMPLLVQETFGLAAFGRIFGLINFLTLSAALIGPPLVGASFDATGSYNVAFATIAGLFVTSAVIISFARPLVLPGPTPATTTDGTPIQR